jgi:four helix bundle protein
MQRDSEAMKLRTKTFALRVVRLYRALPRSNDARIFGDQLLPCSTSIAANYTAACRGRSRAEFISKFGVVLEEADEAVFWLEMIQDAKLFSAAQLSDLLREARELLAIFVSSVRSAKGKFRQPAPQI